MDHESLLLSYSDVKRCVDIKEAVEIVQRTFRAHGEGEVIMPPKVNLNLEPKYKFWSNAMPAYVGPYDAAGMKWAGGFDNNPSQHNLPFIMATILFQDPSNGVILSAMDGNHITALRTGAAGAVCASLTWVPGASSVAIIGAGVQGRCSLEAINCLMAIKDARVVDVLPSVGERFAREESEKLGVPVRACATAQEAVEGADVVITATASRTPIVSNGWLKPGVAVVSIGSYQEFDDEFVLGVDKIVVDNLEQCTHRGELGQLFHKGKLTREDIYANVGEVAAGKKPGRDSNTERVLSVPLGLGSLDIAVAALVYKRAREMGLGSKFNFLA